MARADLHYALVLDREIYEASKVDPDLLDPVVRLEGGLPGPARPVAVLRRYQGPQGYYREQFTITDPDGAVIYRSPIRRIGLEGEFSEDEFRTFVYDLLFTDSGEHTAHFLIDGEEAGSVPVFLEAGSGGSLTTFVQETFGAALKKGDILWVTVAGRGDRRTGVPLFRGIIPGRHESPQAERSQAVWIVWEDGLVYVLNGPGGQQGSGVPQTEQHVPGLSEADEVELTVRSKDIRSAVARVPADVRRVPPDSDEWERIANKMLAARLNVADEEEALSRWREKCDILALSPRFGAEEELQADVAAPAAATAGAASGAGQAGGGQAGGGQAGGGSDAEPKVENVQIDQEVYDQLISEGKSERVATAKAKAAWVRNEKARLRGEQQESASA